MGRAWDHGELAFAAQLLPRLAVEVKDKLVALANNQEGGRANGGEAVGGAVGEVGPAAARDDR